MADITDARGKFSGRGEFYAKSRPSYSGKLIDALYSDYGFSDKSVIADVGAGTGKFSVLLAKRGSQVICVEPNADMRAKLAEAVKPFPGCRVLTGSAEETGIPPKTADFVTAAQAFHWFDCEKFKRECKRIMKPGGKVVLVWNTRELDADVTLESQAVYEKYCPGFTGFSAGMHGSEDMINLFFSKGFDKICFESPLNFDEEGFINRSISSSFSLRPGDEKFEEYIDAVREVFSKYQSGGRITVPNTATAYIGKI